MRKIMVMNKVKEKELTPLQSVRKFCLFSHGGSPKEVANCPTLDCPLYPYRLGCGRMSVKAVKISCLECMNENGNGIRVANELIRKCPSYDCPLFAYRLGRNPNRAGIGRAGGNPSLAEKGAVRLCKAGKLATLTQK